MRRTAIQPSVARGCATCLRVKIYDEMLRVEVGACLRQRDFRKRRNLFRRADEHGWQDVDFQARGDSRCCWSTPVTTTSRPKCPFERCKTASGVTAAPLPPALLLLVQDAAARTTGRGRFVTLLRVPGAPLAASTRGGGGS